MTDRVKQVIDSVEGGVCKSIDELLNDIGFDLAELSKEEVEDIDDAIFTCSLCGWTMSCDERAEDDDDTCLECYDDLHDL